MAAPHTNPEGGPLPPTSPLAHYPSPFAEGRRALARDLQARTFSTGPEEAYVSPTDRIGRNYTPTAFSLSAKVLGRRLASGVHLGGPVSVAAAAARPGEGQVGGGGGGGGEPPLRLSLPPPSGKPLASHMVPRRGGRPAAYYKIEVPDFLKEGTWAPLTQEQTDGAAIEAALRERSGGAAPGARAEQLARTLADYHAAVEAAAPEEALPPVPEPWTDGVLARVVDNACAPARKRWVDAQLVVPPALMAAAAGGAFLPPQPAVPPSVHVEALLSEARALAWVRGLRVAALDYALRHPRGGMEHRGLALHLVDTLRHAAAPPRGRAEAGATLAARPLAGLSLARALALCEAVLPGAV